jgi:hypothetical protein
LLVLYSNFIGVKWEKEALVPRVGEISLIVSTVDRAHFADCQESALEICFEVYKYG